MLYWNLKQARQQITQTLSHCRFYENTKKRREEHLRSNDGVQNVRTKKENTMTAGFVLTVNQSE